MRKPLIVASLAAGAVAAGLGLAAPAMAQPTVTFDCAPCVPGSTTPIWNQIFDPAGDGNGIWETGVTAVNQGIWEDLASSSDGSPGGPGAWERVFPNPDFAPADPAEETP
jgi:hypothetical protein